jgi:NAD(P)-dependent dehydrogenase (short-subunit alcohol dehydrogenase family)
MEPDLGLEGKVAIVAGAAGSIGAEIARTFAAHGAAIVAVDAAESDGAEAARELGAGAVFLACDVRDPDAVCSMVEAAAEKHGRVDILVNASAAGEPGGASWGSPAAGAAEQVSDESFSRGVSVAIDGSYHCAKYAGERMAAAGTGCIVTVVPGSGSPGSPAAVAEAAAAAGAIALTRAMAYDLGARGIRVNAISVGSGAGAVDVAHAALFLASDMASRVSGTTISVGG